MSVKVDLQQLQAQLPALIDRTVETGEECVVEREGEEYAVIVSAREWRRRTAPNAARPRTASSLEQTESLRWRAGRSLDALGPEYRLPPVQQARAEELLAAERERTLSPAEREELDTLLNQVDAIMLRRAEALDHGT